MINKSNWCEEFKSYCACIRCRPIGFCVDDPCYSCDGPTEKICDPPEIKEN